MRNSKVCFLKSEIKYDDLNSGQIVSYEDSFLLRIGNHEVTSEVSRTIGLAVLGSDGQHGTRLVSVARVVE